ncbi:MAG: aldo/keto reductase [Mycobacteriales bacterium]
MSMARRRLGTSGLRVSRLGLGTMTWGADNDAEDAAAQLVMFTEAGGNLIDTADVYTEGASEALLGSMIGSHRTALVPRESVVLATKAGVDPTAPQRRNCSRGHLLSALDTSLRRLGTDYIDLWQLHAWDDTTPLAETLSAVDIALRTGRVRYVGVSNFSAWQLATVAIRQQLGGESPFISAQAEYSLLERSPELELLPAATHTGLGLLPWSPLGRGVLTGKYRDGAPAGSRGASPQLKPFVARFLNERCAGIVEAVATAAEGLWVLPAVAALAWVRDRPGVVAPIVGARNAAQLKATLSSEELTLPEEIAAALADVSATEAT